MLFPFALLPLLGVSLLQSESNHLYTTYALFLIRHTILSSPAGVSLTICLR